MSSLGVRHYGSIVLLLFILLPGCGPKRTPPPAPPSASKAPSRASDRPSEELPRQPSSEAVPPIPGTAKEFKPSSLARVLLLEGFRSAEVGGSRFGSRIKLEVQSKAIRRLIQKQGEWVLLDTGSGFRLEPAPGKSLSLNGVVYRGELEVFINPLGRPVFVNEVGVEDYLRGVVPQELGPYSYPQIEALKTQAVASRTFALAHLGSKASRGYDLYADHRSQVYAGLKGEHSVTDQAIRLTRGLIATFQGKAIVALYSSTCGGKTESYDAIFNRPALPYLRGGSLCPDQKSRYHRWQEKISISRVLKNSETLARLGKLKKLVRSRTSVQGRLLELVWKGSQGEHVLRGNALRFTLGLRSNWVVDFRPLGTKGEIVEVDVKGRGWGHGVGLCQMGAVELARRGWSFERILKHYYQGVELTRAY